MPNVEELNRKLSRGDRDYFNGTPTLNEGSDWRNALEDSRYARDSWGQNLENIAQRYAAVEASQAKGSPEHAPEGIFDYLLRNLKSIDIGKSLEDQRNRDWMDIWQSPNQEGFSPEEIQFAKQFGQSPQSNAQAQTLGMGSMGMRNVAAKAGPPIMELLSALKAKAAPYAESLYGGLKETGENIASKVNQAAPQGIMRAIQQQGLEPVMNPSVDKATRGAGQLSLKDLWDRLRPPQGETPVAASQAGASPQGSGLFEELMKLDRGIREMGRKSYYDSKYEKAMGLDTQRWRNSSGPMLQDWGNNVQNNPGLMDELMRVVEAQAQKAKPPTSRAVPSKSLPPEWSPDSSDVGGSVSDFITARGKPLPKKPLEGYARGLSNLMRGADPMDKGTLANMGKMYGGDAEKVFGERLAGTVFKDPNEASALLKDPSIWDLGINTPDNPMSRTGRALLNNQRAIPASTVLNPLADFAMGAGRDSLEYLGNYVGTDIQKAIALSGMGGMLYKLLQQPGDRKTFERLLGQR